MIIERNPIEKFIRRLILIITFLVDCAAILILCCGAVDALWKMLFLAMVLIALSYGAVTTSLSLADAVLTSRGIEVTHLLRTRLYSWDKLVQVGVWNMPAIGGDHGTIIVVLPGGSRLKHEFEGIVMNRAIRLPDYPCAREYLLTHYGKFDFGR